MRFGRGVVGCVGGKVRGEKPEERVEREKRVRVEFSGFFCFTKGWLYYGMLNGSRDG